MNEDQESLAEDLLIIHETLSGRAEAFGRLVAKYEDYVYDLCLRLLGQRQDAEDAAQETFVKLYRHLKRYKPGHKVSNWVYTIALNECRSRRRRARLLRFFALDAILEPVANDPTAGQGLEQAQERQAAERVISRLPEPLREVFILRYVHDKPIAEIAAILGLSEGNVKVRLHRVRKLVTSLAQERIDE